MKIITAYICIPDDKYCIDRRHTGVLCDYIRNDTVEYFCTIFRNRKNERIRLRRDKQWNVFKCKACNESI